MSFISDLLSFLNDLSRNNNREWFKGNKDKYDDLRNRWITEIERLRMRMIQWEPELARQPLKDCFYRIYRDVRFKQDKTPYKTHFSVCFSPYGRKTDYAAYYFQIGTDESGVYGGIWCADNQMVKKLRKAISDNEEEFGKIADQLFAHPEFSLVGEQLKTAPKGFSTDDPMIKYLRYKELGIWGEISAEKLAKQKDWTETVSEMFRLLKPITDFINYSFDE